MRYLRFSGAVNDEGKVLPVDTLHGQNWNHGPFMRAPDDAGSSELRGAKRVRRSS